MCEFWGSCMWVSQPRSGFWAQQFASKNTQNDWFLLLIISSLLCQGTARVCSPGLLLLLLTWKGTSELLWQLLSLSPRQRSPDLDLLKRPHPSQPNLEMLLLLRFSSMRIRFLSEEADRINLCHVLHLPFCTEEQQWASAPKAASHGPLGFKPPSVFLRFCGAAAWLSLAGSELVCTRGHNGGGPGCAQMQMSSIWSWVVVGLLIIKSCTDLICSLLTFKQLIISNPLPWPICLWNESAKEKLVLLLLIRSSSLFC